MFAKWKVGRSYEIYLSHSSEDISTVHPEEDGIKKDINFGTAHNSFKIQPVTSVHKKSVYYIGI